MTSRSFHGVMWLALAGCTMRQARPAPVPPCFQLFPVAPGARWAYDVDVVSADGATSTHQRARVVRIVGDVARDGAAWRFRLDTGPLPADTGVSAVARYRLAGGNLYDADDSLPDHMFLAANPAERAAWGGPRWFYGPDGGYWNVVDFEDAPPYHDCVKVHAERKYGDVMHVYCAGVGPVMSEYRETTPRSRDDGRVGHRRDEIWRLRSFAPGTCTR